MDRGLTVGVCALVIIAFALDWHSTVIQSAGVEENPLVKFVWERTGDVGFTAFNLVFLLLVGVLACYLVRRSWVAGLAIIPLMVFKIMIALTNYDLLPYSYTAWFQF